MDIDSGKFNIQHEVFSCRKRYEPERDLTRLRTHDCVEVCMITEGCGIHLVLDQPIPCKVGDIFVTPPNIPHAYFLESTKDTLTVRRFR